MILSTETVTPQMPKQRSRSFNAAGEPQGEAKSGETMKAIYLDRKAGTEALVAGEIPRPKPQAGEELVKVHATSVMPTELQWFTTFNLPFGEPRPYPIVLSHEVSGVVESVGAKVNGRTQRLVHQYAASGNPILSAYGTHCTCQVKFLLK